MLRFTLSEPAAVGVALERCVARRCRIVQKVGIAARVGANALMLKVARPGRYRLSLVAIDSVGNVAPILGRT